MKKLLAYFVVMILVAAAIFHITKGDSDKTVIETDHISQIAGLELLTIKTQSTSKKIYFDGRIHAKDRIELFSETPGKFLNPKHPFREGVRFKGGDILVRIDEHEVDLNLRSLRSAFQNLVSSLMPDIHLDYPEYAETFNDYLEEINNPDQSIVQLPEVSDRQLRYFLSSKGLYERFYQIRSAEIRVEKFVIRAPFDGVLIKANVREGSRISPQTHLGTFISHDVEFITSMRKKDAERLSIGNSVKLTDQTETKNWTATVTNINATLDRHTQSIQVYMDVDGEVLLDGIYLKGEAETDEIKEQAFIPRSAYLRTGHVYTLKDGKIQLTPVEMDAIKGEQILVTGLNDGEIVIVNPDRPLTGLKVNT